MKCEMIHNLHSTALIPCILVCVCVCEREREREREREMEGTINVFKQIVKQNLIVHGYDLFNCTSINRIINN
jgi:hypothetical protein